MTTTTLSRRGLDAPSSPIRALAAAARDAQDSGKTVHYMNIGQPDIATPRGMIEAYRNYDEKVLAYAPSDGFEEYREALASKYYNRVIGDLHEDLGQWLTSEVRDPDPVQGVADRKHYEGPLVGRTPQQGPEEGHG